MDSQELKGFGAIEEDQELGEVGKGTAVGVWWRELDVFVEFGDGDLIEAGGDEAEG